MHFRLPWCAGFGCGHATVHRLLASALVLAWLTGPVKLAAFDFFEPVQPPRRVQVMAHRGAAGQAPENTRPALQRCAEDYIEWAEVDVRRTADGRHVLAHDAELTGAGGARKAVASSTLTQLSTLDVGGVFAVRYSGQRMLTLAEALDASKGRLNLYLDCKAVDAELLAKEILSASMERQVVVYDSLANLKRIDAAAPGRLALMAKWHPADGLGDWMTTNRLAAVEIDADEVSNEAVSALHARGVKVQAKVLASQDRPEVWERMARAGVDWLQTDLPEEVRAHLYFRDHPKPPARFSLHRGANRYAPENTIPAFEKAIRLRANLVEFDVRTTSDGKFYLLHDSSFDGKTDGHGPIAAATAAEVDRISAGVRFSHAHAALRLPTLEQFLTAVQGRVDLYFDAKAIEPDALVSAVERHGMAERTVVYQSVPYLSRLKALNPRIRTLPPLNRVEELAALAAKLKPYGVDADWELLSESLIRECHRHGIVVFSDALGKHESVEAYLRAIAWGIDVIQTDHPLRVLRAFELAELRKP